MGQPTHVIIPYSIFLSIQTKLLSPSLTTEEYSKLDIFDKASLLCDKKALFAKAEILLSGKLVTIDEAGQKIIDSAP